MSFLMSGIHFSVLDPQKFEVRKLASPRANGFDRRAGAAASKRITQGLKPSVSSPATPLRIGKQFSPSPGDVVFLPYTAPFGEDWHAGVS